MSPSPYQPHMHTPFSVLTAPASLHPLTCTPVVLLTHQYICGHVYQWTRIKLHQIVQSSCSLITTCFEVNMVQYMASALTRVGGIYSLVLRTARFDSGTLTLGTPSSPIEATPSQSGILSSGVSLGIMSCMSSPNLFTAAGLPHCMTNDCMIEQ